MFRPSADGVLYPHRIAFAAQVARNAMVQGLGLIMVVVVGLGLLPWPPVLAWALITVLAVTAENRLLRRIATTDAKSRGARLGAPAIRLVITSLYAVAAFVFLTRGGLGEYLFAFALISASVVNVLMRHYRAPAVLLVSLSPYLLVLCIVGQALGVRALAAGEPLRALAPLLTVALFAVQVWTARAQLSGAWSELTAALDTAREREQAALAATLTKSRFLTTMSHELRTPLHGVLGMAQTLRDSDLTPAQSGRVDVILQQGQSLLGMLNDLLDLSRVEAGSLELELNDFDLDPLVRGVVAAFEPLALKKGVAFAFDVTDAARGLYRGDEGRIRRVLYSLVDNAVKFTWVGRISLTVDRVEGGLTFAVQDTGVGIAEQDRADLFKASFKSDSTLSRPNSGAGIGLAICSQLTALMGGDLTVRSRPGEGSTFTLHLPLPQIRAARRQAAAAPPNHVRLSQLRVLAAEDNLVNQMVLRAFLEPAGIEPVMVENGRQALDAWEKNHWDVILMDIQMPEMNGIEATRSIRSRELETGRARTPIIAVTASAMAHELETFAAVGMDGVAPKPVNCASLLRMIEQAVPVSAA